MNKGATWVEEAVQWLGPKGILEGKTYEGAYGERASTRKGARTS